MESRSLDQLKHRLPEYLGSLGLAPRFRGEHRLTCRCPLHADTHPSFTAALTETGWLWYCHPCAKGGSVIDLHAALNGLDAQEAIRELHERHPGPVCTPACHHDTPPPWPTLRKGTAAEHSTLATLRGLPVEISWAAQTLGHLRFTEHHGTPCYALTDGDQFLQLRRLDGQPFPFPKDHPRKAWNWKGSKLLPLGVRHLDPEAPILMAEGAVAYLELLALLDLTSETQDSWRWRPLAMTSASSRLPDDLLPKLQGRQIRIIGDRDEAGQRATQLWADQCRLVHCDVDVVDLSALPELDHQPKADLGDLLRLPASTHQTDILNHLVS